MGTVELDMLLPDGSSRKYSLQKVLYVPKPAYNLVSVSRATEAGKSVTFSKGGCEFSDDSGQTTAFATKQVVSTIREATRKCACSPEGKHGETVASTLWAPE